MNRFLLSRFGISLFFIGAIALPILPLHAQTNPSATDGFLAQVKAHFASWDSDRDGVLSPAEVDTLVATPKITGPEAAAIASIKRALRTKSYHLPALTVKAIQERTGTTLSKDQPDFAKLYESSLPRLPKQKVLFASGAPTMTGVHQGKLGDCFCLAPLAAMTARNPQEVASIFTLQPDGKYQVRFGKQQITVTPPTDAEIVMSASTSQGGMWVNLYEKAVGVSRVKDATPPLDNVTKGGSAGTMLSVLTGHDITRFSCAFAHSEKTTPEERAAKLADVRTQLIAAFAEKRLVTCGTERTKTPGITPNHAYAVIGYDVATDSIRLWNPHGDSFTPKGEPGLKYGYPRKDGVFAMPLPDFVDQFAGLAFEVLEKPGASKDLLTAERK